MATTASTAKKTASSGAAKTIASAKISAKKPVAAKAAAPKKAASAAPKKPAAKRAAAAKSVTPEQRYRMVAEAAYFHAERHGFVGDPTQDWIAAEAEIAALLSKK